MIAPGETALYYKAADFFISASTSETQGLTYLEALASGTPIIAHGNPYLDNVITDQMFGTLYYHEMIWLGPFWKQPLQRQKKTRLSGPTSFMKFLQKTLDNVSMSTTWTSRFLRISTMI